MKTSQVFRVMMGATLLSGVALAQADGPQGPAPRGDGVGVRPENQGRKQMERCGRGMQEGGCPMQRQEGGSGGMERQQMQRGCPMLGRGPQEIPGPERLKEVGATEQQMEMLKKLNTEQQLKRIDLQATAEKAEVMLGQIMQNEAVDEKAAFKAVDELSQARAELIKQDISSKLKVREILGAEIIKKIRVMGPPEGMERPGRGPQPEGQGQSRRDMPSQERK
jgi:hypothetical protein